MVNRGEFVVICVVKGGVLAHTFSPRKIRHEFEIYFWVIVEK
jgi:hypothetical protein